MHTQETYSLLKKVKYFQFLYNFSNLVGICDGVRRLDQFTTTTCCGYSYNKHLNSPVINFTKNEGESAFSENSNVTCIFCFKSVATQNSIT